MEPKKLHKIARTALNTWKIRQIKNQGGVCPISLKEFDVRDAKDWVVDHSHFTGEIRGILWRATNSAEGKVKNAIARWGGVGDDHEAILAWAKRLVAYWESEGTGFLYPLHKELTPAQELAKLKRKEARASLKARKEVARQRALLEKGKSET